MLLNAIIYLVAFIAIWLGSGFIVASTNQFSKRLRLSSFAFSFIFLGILTSIPEFSVGLQAVAEHDAEIFVGNLLGGVIVIFLLIIPLLAVFGNGINLRNELDDKTMFFTIIVILSPALLVLDKRVTNPEGILFIMLYLAMLIFVQKKKGLFDSENTNLLNTSAYSPKDLLKILLGIGVVFVSSNIIVDKTLYFADVFSISPFYIGLIIISLGTNLPELSLAVRSVLGGRKEIAMGDYIGSAAANTLLFGVFTLLHNGEVLTVNHFFVPFFFIALSLCIFYFLFVKRNFISRRSGILMLVLYIFFLVLEFV